MSQITCSNNQLIVSGDLDFTTVPALWEQSLLLCASLTEFHFNLEKVTSSNSAGVALLLEWIKLAKAAQKKITFTHIPAQLQSIIQATGIKLL